MAAGHAHAVALSQDCTPALAAAQRRVFSRSRASGTAGRAGRRAGSGRRRPTAAPSDTAMLLWGTCPRRGCAGSRPLILLGAYGGLRIGEMAGLRRARVDLTAGTVQVVEGDHRAEGRAARRPAHDARRPPHGRAAPVRRRRARRAAGGARRARGPRVRRAARRRAARVAVPQPLLAAGGAGRRPGRAAHPRPSEHGGGAVDRGRRPTPRRSRPGPATPR
jgi:integrase